MSDPHIQAAFYLSPTLDALWRWDDDGQVLAWTDGTTIAFRAEVEAVLARLAPGGLPPFGAVALVLAACRDGWIDSAGRKSVAGYGQIVGSTGPTTAHHGAVAGAQLVFGRVTRDIAQLLEGLDAVSQLPREQREDRPKALLCEVVFEAAKNRSSIEDAKAIMQAIEDGIAAETLRPQLCHEESLSQFARQVDGLHEGLARIDSEELARRKATGIDQPVSPAEDLSPPQRVRRLLASLRDDDELAGMAQLAHDLMAAVGIPRTLRVKDELPAGGVSDLSNRGPLDRLLVSELAHDDLTLAIRVAVNEALYLRPESPPREPPHRRAILIDSGIRMWGVPRVFAMSAALALAATNDPHANLCAFRATRAGAAPIDLTTRRGVNAHLGALETSPHPGAALAAFVEAATHESEAATDLVVITHADVLSDPEFHRAVAAIDIPLYVATVESSGDFHLWMLTRGGKKPVRDAKLSLDGLFGRPKPTPRKLAGVPLIATDYDTTQPAICYANPLPFHLPCIISHPRKAAASATLGLVGASDDGRLLHWADNMHGARQLTALLPRGQVQLVTIDEARAWARVVLTHRGERAGNIVTADLQSGHCSVCTFVMQEGEPRRMFEWAGILYAMYAERVDAFDLAGGQFLATAKIPKRRGYQHGRFFSNAGSFHAIAYDGTSNLKVERLKIRYDAIAVFDRAGVDGPCALLASGHITDGSGKSLGRSDKPGRIDSFLGISPDGHRIACKVNGCDCVMDLEKESAWQSAGSAFRDLLHSRQLPWSTRSQTVLRRKYERIFVDGRSRLCLLSTRGAVVTPARTEHGELQLQGTLCPDARSRGFRFLQQPRQKGARLALEHAAWNDGSQAFLDPRGMLHLKSSDRSVPELTMTLTNLVPAFWSSEGKISGPKFLVRDAPQTDAAYFEDILRRFVARLR